MRVRLREDAGRRVSVNVELWRGRVPPRGLKRYLWDRLWRRVYGPFTRIYADGRTKRFP